MDYVDRMLMVAKIFSGSKMDLLPSAKTRDAWMLRSKRVLLLRDGSRTTTARCPMDGVRAVLFWLRGLEFAADAVGRECPSARYRFFDRLGSPLCISHARSEPPAVFPKPPREAACSTRPGGCRLFAAQILRVVFETFASPGIRAELCPGEHSRGHTESIEWSRSSN